MPVTRRSLVLVAAVLVVAVIVGIAVVNWPRVQGAAKTAASGGDLTIEVPSMAMSPSIELGDSLAVSTEEPFELVVGDVVTTRVPGDPSGTTTLKRIIAIGPADVSFVDGKVLVDGTAIEEPYLAPGTMTEGPPDGIPKDCAPGDPCHVPEGSFWGMGDNRRQSRDSRSLGPIPLDMVDGVVLAIVAPAERAGAVAGSDR